MPGKRNNTLKYLPLVIAFCVFIFIPLITSAVQEDRNSSRQENRNLSPLPALPRSIAELKALPRKLDDYYADHFGFREQLNSFYFTLMGYVSSSSTGRDITQGQEGWLFLGSIKPGYEGYSDPMGDAMHINRYTQAELVQFAQYLAAIKQWLATRGIEYVYVVTPIKHTIYFDKLPAYIERKNDQSALDQVIAYLRANTDVTIIDLRETLMQEREQLQVYYQTDSHWNSYGANAAQHEIMTQINTLFPGKVSPLKLNPDQFDIGYITNGDLARSANITDAREQAPSPRFDNGCVPDKENAGGFRDPFTMVCDTAELNALIFRDSYFTALEPYFSRQFKRSTYIWDRLDFTTLSTFVEQEQPDIVIDQVVERSLPYMPNGKPFVELLSP